jgi:RNA polymerase sigma-70 factor (TIGR02943 family)
MSSETSLPDPEKWVDLFGDYLYRFAVTRVSDSDKAQDLVQEALVAALQSYSQFQGRSSIKTWLIAILKRKIVDYYRRKKSQKEIDLESISDSFDDSGHWHEKPNDWALNPGAAYEQKEFMQVLFECLAKLPARLAEIFMLREFEELGTEAICEQLKISESNSWVMLFRARMQLRKCLEQKWVNTGEGK